MNTQALRAFQEGNVEKALDFLTSRKGSRRKIAENTMIVMAHLDDDQWDGIDSYIDHKWNREPENGDASNDRPEAGWGRQQTA